MNARIQEATNRIEREHIGAHTFEPETARVNTLTDEVQTNRDLLINTCISTGLRLMNTMFYKPKHKLATYRTVGTTREMEITRPTHEQIDYIGTTQRWKKTQ